MLNSLNENADGWATDLALSLSIFPCTVPLEASKLAQSCTLELFREIRRATDHLF